MALFTSSVYNTMTAGRNVTTLKHLCKDGRLREALYTLNATQDRADSYAYVSLLKACIQNKALQDGTLIHAHIDKRGFSANRLLGNTLLNLYVKCGNLEHARRVFDRMPERDVCSWTVMIAAYSRHGSPEEAWSLFHEMPKTGIQPNQFTFSSVLLTCANMASLENGIEIHRQIEKSGFESDVVVGTALVDMYAKCGSIEKARELFDKMHQPDIVSWNAMITGYAQNGLVHEALKLFKQMPERDAFSWTGMIAGYAQNGLLEEALKLFNEMPHRTVVSWNAMISGLAHHDRGTEALKLFEQMQSAGVKPNSNTFVGILPVCANLAVFEQGMQIHEKIMRFGFQSHVPIANALVDMYAKCGCIQKAREVFDEMPQRNVVSWTTMIVAYAMHGFGREALVLFEQMIEDGMIPDHITFVGVLTACSRAGLVNEGYVYFNQMVKKYNILPVLEHYRCMVDLLGRAGHLDEAFNFIKEMPVKPDAVLWICLLGACRLHNNVELAECAAEHIFELDPQNTAPYVLLSNIYAAARRWSDIAKLRKMMKDRGLKKTPGCSWIEVNNQVHAFFVGDGIDAKLQNAIQKG